jgi:septal ring-binding cell division protein DamX
MGSLNFQDEQGQKSQSEQPTDSGNLEEPKVQDIFVDAPTSGSKFLWVAIIVIVIAGAGGGLYLLNQYGYLKFGENKTSQPSGVSQNVANQPPPAAEPAESPSKVEVPPPAPSAKVPQRFALQVSAFRTKPVADEYAAKLQKKGIDANVVAGVVPHEGKWFKVCVGSFDTKLRAIAAIEEMKKKVRTDVWVVSAE